MAISREVTVWCDHCLNWTRHSGNATSARAEAKKQGWARVREGRFVADVCPDCQKGKKELPDPTGTPVSHLHTHFPGEAGK